MNKYHITRTLIWGMACDGFGTDDIIATLKKHGAYVSRDYVKGLVFEQERQRHEHQRESESKAESSPLPVLPLRPVGQDGPAKR